MFTIRDNLVGVILAGGNGSRLDGKGKYNQVFNNKTFLENVYMRINKQLETIAVNVNNKNRNIKLKTDIIIDQFSNNIGPLAGIHAALCYAEKKLNNNNGYVCTVPVDTPFLPQDLAIRLFKNINKFGADVVFAKSGNRIHPTIAIWQVGIKSKLENSINEGVRKIDLFTSDLKVSLEEWQIIDIDPFYNINNYDDLKQANTMSIIK